MVEGSPANNTCACDDEFVGSDCSKSSTDLEFGVPVTSPLSDFEIHLFRLDVGALAASNSEVGCVERCCWLAAFEGCQAWPCPACSLLWCTQVSVEASYFAVGVSHWLAVHPAVLISVGDDYPSGIPIILNIWQPIACLGGRLGSRVAPTAKPLPLARGATAP